MSRPGRCLLPLLLLLSFSAADAGPPKAKPGAEGPWKVGPNDFVHYQLDVERFGRGEQPNTTPGEPLHNAFGLFGYEIQDGERPMRALFNEEWLVFNYVLWMPERLTRKGRSIAIRDDPVEYGRQHATVRGRGKLSAAAERKTEDTHEVDLVGSVVFETAPDPEYVRGGKTPKGSGRLTWQATFDLEEGLMRRAEFALSVDDAGYGTYPNGSGARKERRITFEGTLVLHKRLPYRYPGFEREVGKAIERGMEGIRAKRDDLGVWSKQGYYPMGRTALGLLALVKGGWDRSDDALAKIVEWLLAQEPESTYSVGLALAAIEAYRAPDRELGLGEKKADSEHGTRTLTKDERRFAETLTDYLVENGQIGPVTPRRGAAAPEGRRKRRGRGATSGEEYIRWGYPGRHRNAGVEVLGGGDASDYWDNSNSQYAVLGLHSASLSGVEVPRHVWFKVLGHFLRHQRLDGPPRPHLELKDAKDGTTRYATSSRYLSKARSRGWGYGHMDGDEERTHTSAYGSMTCAGISSLAIADGALVRLGVKRYGKEERKRVREAIRDGFAFLDENWAAWCNPLQGSYYWYYYLYGLERAAMLTGIKWIGAHDWYWEGAVQLILCQDRRGLWRRDLVETAFAVLFLKRGTKPVITPR